MMLSYGVEAQTAVLFSPGVSYQDQFMYEANLMLYQQPSGFIYLGFGGYRIGVETNFKSKDFVIAPKVNTELNIALLSVRVGFIDYISKGNHDLRFLPEIGLTLSGAANLMYGYGVPLLKNCTDDISRHRITLTFNISERVWRKAI